MKTFKPNIYFISIGIDSIDTAKISKWSTAIAKTAMSV